jgi:hypothetical protein
MVDIAIDGIGTEDASFDGFGKGDGRTYTIEFAAEDGEGGSTTGSVTVEVPHDQRGRAKGSAKPAASSVETTTWGTVKTSR